MKKEQAETILLYVDWLTDYLFLALQQQKNAIPVDQRMIDDATLVLGKLQKLVLASRE